MCSSHALLRLNTRFKDHLFLVSAALGLVSDPRCRRPPHSWDALVEKLSECLGDRVAGGPGEGARSSALVQF